jgi:hypothetical protein
MLGFMKRQPPENKLLINEVQRISDNYRGPNIFDGIIAKAATKEVIDGIKKDFSFARETIAQGGWSARDAAYLIVSEFAASALQSGHLQRGPEWGLMPEGAESYGNASARGWLSVSRHVSRKTPQNHA